MFAEEEIAARAFLIPPENIAGFKFLIESYEGLAVIRTLDPKEGKIVALATDDTLKLLDEVVESVKQDFQIIRIKLPDKLAGDWLLADREAERDS